MVSYGKVKTFTKWILIDVDINKSGEPTENT